MAKLAAQPGATRILLHKGLASVSDSSRRDALGMSADMPGGVVTLALARGDIAVSGFAQEYVSSPEDYCSRCDECEIAGLRSAEWEPERASAAGGLFGRRHCGPDKTVDVHWSGRNFGFYGTPWMQRLPSDFRARVSTAFTTIGCSNTTIWIHDAARPSTSSVTPPSLPILRIRVGRNDFCQVCRRHPRWA